MRRSMLFLPGNNPNMLQNGDILGADAIILDLEDAVSPDEKDAARILVRNAIRTLDYQGCEIIIRINAVDDTGFWKEIWMRSSPSNPISSCQPRSAGRSMSGRFPAIWRKWSAATVWNRALSS